MSAGNYPIKIGRVMYVRRGNCQPGKRPRGKCTPGKVPILPWLTNHFPISDYESLSSWFSQLDCWSLFNLCSTYSTQKRCGGESPRMQTYLVWTKRPRGEKSNVWAKRPWGETYSGRNVMLPFHILQWFDYFTIALHVMCNASHSYTAFIVVFCQRVDYIMTFYLPIGMSFKVITDTAPDATPFITFYNSYICQVFIVYYIILLLLCLYVAVIKFCLSSSSSWTSVPLYERALASSMYVFINWFVISHALYITYTVYL